MKIPKFTYLYRKDLEFKNYSENTIKSYENQVNLFLKYFNGVFTEPSKINQKSIKGWIMEANTTNTRKHRLSALKLFYKFTVKQPLKFKNVEYPKSEKKLPKVIDFKKIKTAIDNIKNTKHKAIIALGYGCMLRVSEVINLKISDIDSKRMVVIVRNSKGRKDRIITLSQNLLDILREYYKAHKPKEYLFNGQNSPKYSSTSCNAIMKKYLGKNYHYHQLRHSGATNLLENGTDISLIQKLLGHNNIKTTMVYTHVSTALLSKIQMPV